MSNTQAQNETATQLFARLVNMEKTSSAESISNFSTTNEYMESSLKSASEKRLIQLENDLMINKTLHLDKQLFVRDVSNKDIIEIYGKFGTGKTEMIMHLLSRYLLPSKWNINSNLKIDLSDFSSTNIDNEPSQMPKAILINTDGKFNIQRLFLIMEERIKIVLKKMQIFSDEILKQLKKFIRDCLKNLVVYNCFTNDTLVYALVACENFLKNLLLNPNEHKTVFPIFIDTINSNFEIYDKFNYQFGFCDSSDHTENFCVQLIKQLVLNFNICIISSRVDMSIKSMKNLSLTDNCLSNSYKKWQAIVNKRIELVSRFDETGIEIFFYRYVDLKTKEVYSNGIKTDTNILNSFTRFDIRNDGINLKE